MNPITTDPEPRVPYRLQNGYNQLIIISGLCGLKVEKGGLDLGRVEVYRLVAHPRLSAERKHDYSRTPSFLSVLFEV